MGRLFWKFFIAIWVAQLLGTMSVMFAVEGIYRLEESGRPRVAADRSTRLVVDAAAATLTYGGPVALHELVARTTKQTLIAVDENNRDIFGRPVDQAALQWALDKAGRAQGAEPVRQVTLPDGRNYLLFVQDAANGAEGHDIAPLPPHGAKLLPTEPLFAHMTASLLVAAALAHYLLRPIRNLRSAIRTVASGHLEVTTADSVVRRNDELADLLREFDRMAEQVSGLVEGQRQLFHAVSHELRSPLARMQVAIGLARQQPRTVEQLLDRVEREIVRLDRLVGELLALSRLATIKIEIADEEFCMDEILAEIVESARFEAEPKGQQVRCTGRTGAMLKGSPELMQRAIENVVRNALEHTPGGSTITVETGLEAGNSMLRVCVSDNGLGVPDKDIDRLFEMPSAVAGLSYVAVSRGLGLAIAKRIIEAHHGRIHARNLPDGGLRVEIVLPVSLRLPT